MRSLDKEIKAFTLLELAVTLLIIGLVLGFAVTLVRKPEPDTCYATTRLQLETVQARIEQFVRSQNRYPKPARMDDGSDHPEFGKESSTGVTSVSGVLIGGLPTASLGLTVHDSADCWGSKITYAITESLTSDDAGTGYPSGAPGGIVIQNGSFSNHAQLTAQAAYAVISHGADRDGATPLATSPLTPRSCTVTGTKIDTENCDVGSAANSQFYTAPFNNGSADGFFDDVMVYAETAIILRDCDPASITWGGGMCGVTTAAILGDGATLNAQPTTAPPGTAGYSGVADIFCDHGTLVALNTNCTTP